MRVLLDGVEIAAQVPSLEEGLSNGVAAAEQAGRIIIQVAADGKPLPDEPQTSSVQVLELTTADPKELVGGTLKSAAEALETVRAQQHTAADLIQSGRTAEGLDHLQAALATWQVVRDVLSQASQLMGCDLSQVPLPVEGAGLAASVSDLAGCLRELKQASEREDWSALADIIAYDLDAAAGRWGVLLSGLSENLPARRVGGA